MCLRFVFLLIMRLAEWLRLSRCEEAWETAQILILRHQLAVLQRRQPRRPRLDWADRALLATLLAVIPKARRHGLHLLVTPDTVLRWHRDIVRRRWAARSLRGKTGRAATRFPGASHSRCQQHVNLDPRRPMLSVRREADRDAAVAEQFCIPTQRGLVVAVHSAAGKRALRR